MYESVFHLLIIITKIINHSLLAGHIQSLKLKTTVIRPLLKKTHPGSRSSLQQQAYFQSFIPIKCSPYQTQ